MFSLIKVPSVAHEVIVWNTTTPVAVPWHESEFLWDNKVKSNYNSLHFKPECWTPSNTPCSTSAPQTVSLLAVAASCGCGPITWCIKSKNSCCDWLRAEFILDEGTNRMESRKRFDVTWLIQLLTQSSSWRFLSLWNTGDISTLCPRTWILLFTFHHCAL